MSAGKSGAAVSGSRILIYGINYAPELIGVGRYSGEIGAYLAARGHGVRVVAAPPHYPGWQIKPPYLPWRYSSERLDGARVIRCPLALRTEMRGIWRLIAPLSFALSSGPVAIWEILRHRPEIVLCVEPTLFSAPVAVLAAKLVGARTVLHVQDLEIDAAFATGYLKSGIFQRLAWGFERSILRSFDRIVTISHKMRERLAAKGVADERFAIVRNWVDLEKIRPVAGRNPFRDELGLGEDDFVALYAGNIGVKQALPVMLDAASALSNETKIIFVVAGDGPEKPGLVARYGHLANVRFLPLQPEEKLNDLLNLADVHVLPQDAGTADLVLPSKLGGMLASGKRLVVTADQGTELAMFLDGAAAITPPGDSAALAAMIAALARRGPDDTADRRLKCAALLSKQDGLKLFEDELLGSKASQGSGSG